MGDILVFLTGQDDIDAAVQMITEEPQNRRKNSSGAEDVADLSILNKIIYFNDQSSKVLQCGRVLCILSCYYSLCVCIVCSSIGA